MSKFFFCLFLPVFASAAFKCPDLKIPKNGNENKKLETFFAASWKDMLKDAPEWGYDLGYAELGDRWTDESIAAYEMRDQKTICLQKTLGAIKRAALNSQNKLNYDLYKNSLEKHIAGQKFPRKLLALDQMEGVHTDVADTLGQMQQQNKTEVLNILKRLEKIPQKMEQNRILLEEGLKQGVTTPQVVLKKVPEQFDEILKENISESALYKPFKELKNLDSESRQSVQKQAQVLIKEKVYPAIRNLKKFLVETYIPGARKTISIQDLPLGHEWYQWEIKRQTTTDLTADQIHDLGLKEVARILSEMEKIKTQVGFKKDLKAFNEFLLKDPQFYYTKVSDLMLGYRDIAKRADAALPPLFKTLPRLPYGVREMPEFKAPSAPAAYYIHGGEQAGRAGFFEANTHDLKTRPKWAMEALTLHEAVPGHHLQIALAQELGNMPDFRKHGGYTAFIEGWGLYAESLGEDMGFYQDPYSKYGQLSYEIWRAVRLVVDTGMHAKGWSREKALQYFMDHMPKSRLEAEVEIDRYIVMPGQALAYKIGEMKFLELKALAKNELKEKFNIREFHDAVLLGGALPLNILEARVQDWIVSQKKATRTELN